MAVPLADNHRDWAWDYTDCSIFQSFETLFLRFWAILSCLYFWDCNIDRFFLLALSRRPTHSPLPWNWRFNYSTSQHQGILWQWKAQLSFRAKLPSPDWPWPPLWRNLYFLLMEFDWEVDMFVKIFILWAIHSDSYVDRARSHCTVMK